MKSQIPELQQRIEDFETKLLSMENGKDAQTSWKSLRKLLDEALRETKKPQGASQRQLPLILLATPEIVSLPQYMGNLAHLVQTGDGGGLADISSAVVTELYQQGVNVHVAVPNYKNLFTTLGKRTEEEYLSLIGGVQRETNRVHFINDALFEKATHVYHEQSLLDRINQRKANAFMRGIIYNLLDRFRSQNPNMLIHCNDWMTGLIPAAAKSRNVRSLMTFHNIYTAYQTPHSLYQDGIEVSHFLKNLFFEHHPDLYPTQHDLYRFNNVDFMTSGLFAADYINTVSPTFLEEIVQGEFQEIGLIPESMRAIIRERYQENRATGILNAPMVTADPQVDRYILRNYTYRDVMEGKAANKAEFQKRLDLEEQPDWPIFYWPHRLASPQKGAELMIGAIPRAIAKYGNIQFAIVANGQDDLARDCRALMRRFPGKVAHAAFGRELSQLGKGASDFIICPSLYEPCGIPQVEGPRYGTLPVVRKTGGLADTIDHLSATAGNGFVFQPFTVEGLEWGIAEAMRFHIRPAEDREKVLRRVMQDSFKRFSITRTVNEYVQVYEEILGMKVR